MAVAALESTYDAAVAELARRVEACQETGAGDKAGLQAEVQVLRERIETGLSGVSAGSQRRDSELLERLAALSTALSSEAAARQAGDEQLGQLARRG